MTRKPTQDSDDGDGRGCVFIIGLVIIGIALGNIYGAAAGWMIVGVGLIAIAML